MSTSAASASAAAPAACPPPLAATAIAITIPAAAPVPPLSGRLAAVDFLPAAFSDVVSPHKADGFSSAPARSRGAGVPVAPLFDVADGLAPARRKPASAVLPVEADAPFGGR